MIRVTTIAGVRLLVFPLALGLYSLILEESFTLNTGVIFLFTSKNSENQRKIT